MQTLQVSPYTVDRYPTCTNQVVTTVAHTESVTHIGYAVSLQPSGKWSASTIVRMQMKTFDTERQAIDWIVAEYEMWLENN